jgi:hypothetical protein
MIVHESTYQKYSLKELWTIEQAIKLAIGHDPDYWLNGTMIGFEDNDDEIAEGVDEEYHELEEQARLALINDTLKPVTGNNALPDFSEPNNKTDNDGYFVESAWARKILVQPKQFLIWAQKQGSVSADIINKISNDNDHSSDLPKYISPYIQLMIKASKELKITEDDIRKKEEIMEWFEQNTPSDLPLSPSQIKNMATFVRSAKAARGGNKRI